MKKNVGSTDKIIRIVIAIASAYYAYTGAFEAAWLSYVLYAVAALMVITTFMSSCPLYSILGIKTCEIKE